MTEETLKTIETLEFNLSRLINKESVIYFLVYSVKNPRASVKYIYDFANQVKTNGYNVKMLVEDNTYVNVNNWYGDRFDHLEIVSIKNDKPMINIDDFVIVPEYYSNVLPTLVSFKCSKIMLVQQKDYVFDTLNIGSQWIDYGFDRCITTTQETKRYIDEFFKGTLTYVIPPFIDDVFGISKTPQKPYVAINCRDRHKTTKIISEFYIKYPHLRWITFRDMVQKTYDEFANELKECMVSIWIDDESTFGTFPIESMKCNIPVIGKVPTTKPEWIGENGIWITNEQDINQMLSSYILSWIDNQELYGDFEKNMEETAIKYTKNIFNENVDSVFNTIYNARMELFSTTINNLKNSEK